MERQILVNQIMTPDGTMLESRYTHDYQTYVDKNGLTYMVDGGLSYLKRSGYYASMPGFVRWFMRVCDRFNLKLRDDPRYREMSIFTDSPFEEIRKYVKRGGRGINGDEPLKYVALKDINDEWLDALISWEKMNRPNNPYLKVYEFERIYRENMNIKIK